MSDFFVPIATCSICGDECYSDDYLVDGDIVCPACSEYWLSDEMILIYLMQRRDDLDYFLENNTNAPWWEQFKQDLITELREDMLEWIKK